MSTNEAPRALYSDQRRGPRAKPQRRSQALGATAACARAYCDLIQPSRSFLSRVMIVPSDVSFTTVSGAMLQRMARTRGNGDSSTTTCPAARRASAAAQRGARGAGRGGREAYLDAAFHVAGALGAVLLILRRPPRVTRGSAAAARRRAW